MKTKTLSHSWKAFLIIAALAGAILRLIYVEDMEFKDDEHYNFIQTQLIGRTDPWPWVGMPSGAFLPNPGMSIWVFVWLARIIGAQDPTSLAQGLQFLSWIGICLLIPFTLYFVRKDREEETPLWLWTFALAMVNPFAVYYQRKLWPEPFFPFFSMLFLMGWWRRNHKWGAFTWGLIGAILGQIHMSGFFYAGAFFLWTLWNEKKISREFRVHWNSWLLGSILGALPLIPWAFYILNHGTGVPQGVQVSGRWDEIFQLKFWVFWISDPLGLHLGNPLGLLHGNSHWSQLSDFLKYPLIQGHATYLNGLAHLIVLAIGASLFVRILISIYDRLRNPADSESIRKYSPTILAQNASLWGFGILITATGVMIRRYYMAVSFPFEWVWLVGLLINPTSDVHRQRFSNRVLSLLWFAQLFISVNFVGYIHVNHGALQGDYGSAFHVVRENNLKTTGKPWADRPNF